MSTEEQQPKVLCAAMLVSVILAGCALFDDAERAVRLQRGTHMYPGLYDERPP